MKPRTTTTTTALPILAIALNALLWGLSWWPLHQLRDRGVHGLWATFFSYMLTVALVLLWRPRTVGELAGDRRLWLLMLTSGVTNACFNWAISTGDVVRVVLLLYLMPVWSVLLSWWQSGERPGLFTLLRIAITLVGVMLVLQPPENAWNQFVLPVPRSQSDVLALISGFAFACSNVLLNRLGKVATPPKILGMFAGNLVVSGTIACVLWQLGLGGVSLPQPVGYWPVFVAMVTLQLVICSICLQYGAARMSANTLALLMTLEVLFAAVSAAWLGAGKIDARVLLGGVLVVGAALLEAYDHLNSARMQRPASPSSQDGPAG